MLGLRRVRLDLSLYREVEGTEDPGCEEGGVGAVVDANCGNGDAWGVLVGVCCVSRSER